MSIPLAKLIWYTLIEFFAINFATRYNRRMLKARIFLVLGVWVAILPYLGFPSSLKNILFSITGLVFIYLSFVVYKDSKNLDKKKKTFDNFSENIDFIKKEIASE